MKPKIGNIEFKNRIFLAPMHQINDMAFRLLCKKAGAGLAYTGLINPQTREKLNLEDNPAIQFACNSDKGIKEFIKKHDKKVCLYDFNLGCPSPHAKSSKIGYFMINSTKKIEEILKTIRASTLKPLTIKIRMMPENNLKKIIKIANKYCDAISIHPRTQIQGYSGNPNLEFAKQVKSLTALPVIYSGNINNKEQAEKMLRQFEFIMIGRACIGNPSIFSELIGKKIKEKLNFSRWYNLAKNKIKPLYSSQVKFQAINFTRNFKGAPKARKNLSLAKSEKEILNIMKQEPQEY